MELRAKNATKGVIWGILNKIEGLLMPFASRTVLIYILGIEYIGLNSLFSSVLQVLNFSELGLGSAIVYLLYKPIAENDEIKIRNILAFCKKCYRWIGSIILIVGLLLTPFIKNLINGDVPNGINIYILYLINLVNSAMGYYLFSYKQSLLIAAQRTDLYSLCGIISDVSLNLLQIIILLISKDFYFYSVVKILATIINSVLCQIITKRLYPTYFAEGDISKKQKNDVKFKVGGMVFQKISNVILISADTIIISIFMNLKILGSYNSYYYVVNGLVLLIGAIDTALLPMIGNYIVSESLEKNKKFFFKMDYLSSFIICWFTVYYFILCQNFMKLWIGEKNMFSIIQVVLFSVYFFFYRIKDTVNLYIDGSGLWWKVKFIAFATAMFNLITNIILIQFIGINGVILSTIVAFLFIDIPYNAKILFTEFFRDKSMLKKYLFRKFKNMIQVFLIIVITSFFSKIINYNGIIGFLIKAIYTGVISFISCVIIMSIDRDFRSAVKEILSGLFRR